MFRGRYRIGFGAVLGTFEWLLLECYHIFDIDIGMHSDGLCGLLICEYCLYSLNLIDLYKESKVKDQSSSLSKHID